MATTYIDLVNIALRDINEVPITSSGFTSPRGLQAAAKEMVNRAYADILNYSKEWPFLSEKTAVDLEVATVDGQGTYTTSVNIDHIDWDSFFIESSDGSFKKSLQTISIDFYTQHLRELANIEGGEPMFVYRLKSNDGFGLTPIPDDTGYTVTFAAWEKPTLLSDAADEIVFDERYYNVLIARARYYLWLFRENAQQAQMAFAEFDDGIKRMHRDLVDKQSINMKAT